MDLLLGCLLLAVCLPVGLCLAVLVKVTSGGPVLFRQRRVGQYGEPFEALKFRTMCVQADARLQEILAADESLRREYETYHKLKNDPRVTAAGRWLRRHGLDELPQLWNVLRGDMSLVGPRPYLPAELAKLGDQAEVILQARPGITGAWQVSGRNRIPFETRVELEAAYVRTWSLRGDLLILARTLGVVLVGGEA